LDSYKKQEYEVMVQWYPMAQMGLLLQWKIAHFACKRHQD
jgi:hypothetical protein